MSTPTPSPTPGTSPAPKTTLPAVPSYQGSAGTATPSGTNPNDIWGLGAMYGQPVYLGNSGYRTPYIGNDQSKSSTPEDHVAYGSTQQLMQQIVGMWSAQNAERVKNPNSLTTYEQLQQELWSAGFFGQTAYKDIHVGQWTSQTQSAVLAALGQYETVRSDEVPVTFAEFLNQNAAGAAEGGFNAGGTAAAAPQVSVTDPKEIRAAAQSAAQNALGHSLSDSELDKFVSEFQGQQSAAQLSKASSVSLPELTSEANAFAQQADPGGYQAYQSDAYTNALVNMFLPSSSTARPNITPTPTA